MPNNITVDVAPQPDPKLTPASSKQRKQLDELCDKLTGKYAQLWGRGTIVSDSNKPAMRIDNQGVLTTPFAGQNIQAQTGTVSIAAVGLANTLSDQKMSPTCQKAVEDTLKQALKDSALDQKWRYISGTCTTP
ncbi:hypothetical protein WKI65_24615 [Streptomyces sp. MS1.AVA.3]|uniref:hypothetical protein n=1 Tax=Streptomyces TaxID=1883 RepID=UPI0020210299|nr:hypothetical protein [Streptomyces sp. MCA2]MCL7494316.1 hypothetical protein [Streptomyces sp. MCA2]